jgi:NAD(P)-dependent dehydrogenase (short-subunit alcohol dehydrogenase family)
MLKVTPHPAPQQPEPRHVVITGISQGLGLAMARAFVARGIRVSGCVRDPGRAEQLAAEFGAPHLIRVADVTDLDAFTRFADEACAEGAPNLVIASAGIINARAPAWEIDAAEWRRVMDINVVGVALTARAFIPAMIAAGSGLFVAMSSSWGRAGEAGLAPYCASKFAVEGFIDSIMQELPAGLRAIALDPGGGINTDMLAACLPGEHQDYVTPERWAPGAVAYILDTLYAGAATGSHTVPDQANA